MKRVFMHIALMMFFTTFTMVAQEINATVSINSSKLDETSKQAMQTLENDLRIFINDRAWTSINFSQNEKIDCGFTVIVNEAASPTSFVAELQVQSRRPVFNSTYITPMLNYRDAQISFDYIEYQSLEFDVNNITNNLTAVIAYYIYLILGLDFDSMSSLGGSPYYQTMQAIATNAQVTNQSEWGSFTSSRGRASIVAALNNPSYDDYRVMWYDYHRKGLDEMATNIDVARKNIVTSLSVISELKSSQPNSILVNLFGDAKLDELIDVYSNEDSTEKQKAIESLQRIYPAKSRQIDRLKK